MVDCSPGHLRKQPFSAARPSSGMSPNSCIKQHTGRNETLTARTGLRAVSYLLEGLSLAAGNDEDRVVGIVAEGAQRLLDAVARALELSGNGTESQCVAACDRKRATRGRLTLFLMSSLSWGVSVPS